MTIVHEDPDVPPLLANPQSYVIDPVYASSVEIDRDPVAVGQPTSGPNRFTIHVPTDLTVLSLGAASGRWKTDKGIDGYTNDHIHFETKHGARTVMSLGTPATTSTLKGYGDAPPVSTHGYAMVTKGDAWHDAHLEHYLLSRTHDITLRTMGEAKRAVVQADAGIVELNGGVGVTITGGGVGIGAHTTGLEMKDVGYEGTWGGETPHSLAAVRSAKFNTISNFIVTLHNLLTGAVFNFLHREKYKEGGKIAVTEVFGDGAEWALDAVEEKRTWGEIQELYAKEESPEKAVKIDAEKDFGVTAGVSASFFGTTSATMAATVWASASSVVAATLKGTLFSGVAGTFTSLKGYGSLEIACDHGEAVFSAFRDVKASATKNFIGSGKERARLEGEKHLYVAGQQSTWIGTKAGGGWGLLMAAGGISLGQATSADAMLGAGIVENRSIRITSELVAFQSATTKMEVHGTKIEIEASAVDLDAEGDVYVGGKKVLIDA